MCDAALRLVNPQGAQSFFDIATGCNASSYGWRSAVRALKYIIEADAMTLDCLEQHEHAQSELLQDFFLRAGDAVNSDEVRP